MNSFLHLYMRPKGQMSGMVTGGGVVSVKQVNPLEMGAFFLSLESACRVAAPYLLVGSGLSCT